MIPTVFLSNLFHQSSYIRTIPYKRGNWSKKIFMEAIKEVKDFEIFDTSIFENILGHHRSLVYHFTISLNRKEHSKGNLLMLRFILWLLGNLDKKAINLNTVKISWWLNHISSWVRRHFLVLITKFSKYFQFSIFLLIPWMKLRRFSHRHRLCLNFLHTPTFEEDC